MQKESLKALFCLALLLGVGVTSVGLPAPSTGEVGAMVVGLDPVEDLLPVDPLAVLHRVLGGTATEGTATPPATAAVDRDGLLDAGELRHMVAEVPPGATWQVMNYDSLIPASPLWNGAIGPGTPITIAFNAGAEFGEVLCTANFVWKDSTGKVYLGAAGHCFLPEGTRTTHGDAGSGSGVLYDPKDVTVWACAGDCIAGGQTGTVANIFLGNYIKLGAVEYARQKPPTGNLNVDGEGVGHDFGIVEIPAALYPFVDTSIPVWGGPHDFQGGDSLGDTLLLHGSGVIYGEVFATKSRAGVSLGTLDGFSWEAVVPSFGGDSGSSVAIGSPDGLGDGPIGHGLLTHGIIGAPVAFGTLIDRAEEMAYEDAALCIRPLRAGEDPATAEPAPVRAGCDDSGGEDPVIPLTATVQPTTIDLEPGEAIVLVGAASGGQTGENGFTCAWDSSDSDSIVIEPEDECETTVRFNAVGEFEITLTVNDGDDTAFTTVPAVILAAPPTPGLIITAPIPDTTRPTGALTVQGTALRAEGGGALACTQKGAIEDDDGMALPLFGFTRLCASDTGTEYHILLDIPGLDAQDALGEAASPVMYSLVFDNGQTFDMWKALGGWSVYRYPVDEGMISDQVTVSVDGETLHVRIPANQVSGTPSGVHAYSHVGDFVLGFSANYIAQDEVVTIDRIPAEGRQAFRSSPSTPTASDGARSIVAALVGAPQKHSTGGVGALSGTEGTERVEVYVGDVFLGEDTAIDTDLGGPIASWNVPVTLSEVGTQTLTARWLDADGALLGTSQVSITLTQSVTTPVFSQAPPAANVTALDGGLAADCDDDACLDALHEQLGDCMTGFEAACEPAWAQSQPQPVEMPRAPEVPAVLRFEPTEPASVSFGSDSMASSEATQEAPAVSLLLLLAGLVAVAAMRRRTG